MSDSIRFVLALHDHQPVGNFDGVFEAAYQDSYRPLLDVFEQFPKLRMSLHISGPLVEWLDARRPEFLDRVAQLAQSGRIEIVGGAFYEPILTMIPSRDRVGQIRGYARWLEDRFGAPVQGMWLAERVWEQSIVRDLVDAGVKYTIVDDFHFKAAGLKESQLSGYFLTEDDGRVLAVFPGSEPLRYMIPFQDPQSTIDHLRRLAESRPGAIAVFADDGEKFGTWPDTKKHVYDDGWLRSFFEHLSQNSDWIQSTTLAETLENTLPAGKVFLPDASYREMTEWALPPERQLRLDQLRHQIEEIDQLRDAAPLLRGGFWRNFRVRYSEANEMYARMMMVSERLLRAEASGAEGELVEQARRELYRGQCNCPYWHGAFGGIYLPHLRNGVYRHILAADNLLDQIEGRREPWVEATSDDLNFDARPEVHLVNDRLGLFVAPARGGQIYEFDVRSICHNLLATLMRRPEAYHQKVLAGATAGADRAASIHDRVVFKQEGLDQRLQYDAHDRKSLLDHFYPLEATGQSVEAGDAKELGDFVSAVYEARIRRNPDRIQTQLIADGIADGAPVRITKGITLAAGSSIVEIAYLLEGLPSDRPLHFAVELNFAGLPAGADDRYFFDEQGGRLGQLGSRLDLSDARSLGMCDQWLGVEASLAFNRPTNIWTFPIETVSQSEGGFELIHQSIAVLPHWFVQADEQGRWSVRIQLEIDAQLAERRASEAAVAAGA